MNSEKLNETDKADELPDNWWYRVYLGAIVTTIVVISALGLFSWHFSK